MALRTHPGEILRHEFLKPMEMSATALAEKIGVPANRITEIVRGRRDVTAETALLIAEFFGTTPELWMNLQAAHDLSKAQAARAAQSKREDSGLQIWHNSVRTFHTKDDAVAAAQLSAKSTTKRTSSHAEKVSRSSSLVSPGTSSSAERAKSTAERASSHAAKVSRSSSARRLKSARSSSSAESAKRK